MLLNKGDELTVTALRSELPEGIKFKGSPENERFIAYMQFLKGYAAEQKILADDYKNAKTTADTLDVRTKSAASAKSRTTYTRDFVKAYPGTLLAAIFNAMEVPEVPVGQHLLEDGKTKDSAFSAKSFALCGSRPIPGFRSCTPRQCLARRR